MLLNLYSFFLTGRSLGLRAEEEKKIKNGWKGKEEKGRKGTGAFKNIMGTIGRE